MIAVLDTGAISALAPGDETSRMRLRALQRRVDGITMPAAVLAEGVLQGHPRHDFHIRRLLSLVDIVDVDTALAARAGQLRAAVLTGRPRRPPSGVDALVAALADAQAARGPVSVLTTDPEDLGLLVRAGANRRQVRVSGI